MSEDSTLLRTYLALNNYLSYLSLDFVLKGVPKKIKKKIRFRFLGSA